MVFCGCVCVLDGLVGKSMGSDSEMDRMEVCVTETFVYQFLLFRARRLRTRGVHTQQPASQARGTSGIPEDCHNARRKEK
jgi:hypothetical protein